MRVEAALTAYYLHSDGAFGAGPLRYIDASEPQLRMALKIAHDADPVRLLGDAHGERVFGDVCVAQGRASGVGVPILCHVPRALCGCALSLVDSEGWGGWAMDGGELRESERSLISKL